MGKVEKVVVLGVLFSVLVILAVSMYSSPDDEVLVDADPSARRADAPAATRLDRPRSPLAASREDGEALPAAAEIPAGPASDRPGSADSQGSRAPGAIEASRWQRREPAPVPASAPASAPTLAVAERPQRGATHQSSQPGGLLSSSVRSRRQPAPSGQAGAGQPEAASAPARRSAPDPAWDLITVEGLEPTLDPRFQVYTCSGDETFITLAQALYGSEKKAALLRRDNEGVSDLAEGRQLLIPVVDDRPGGGDLYEVLDGESLWIIAKKVYGAGGRWQEIYEANEDALRSPDDVRPGVVLVIP